MCALTCVCSTRAIEFVNKNRVFFFQSRDGARVKLVCDCAILKGRRENFLRTKRRKKKDLTSKAAKSRQRTKKLLKRKNEKEDVFHVLFLALVHFHRHKKELYCDERGKKDAINVLFRSRRRKRSKRRRISELDCIKDGRVHGHLGCFDERVRVRVVRLGRRISRAETFEEDDDDDD